MTAALLGAAGRAEALGDFFGVEAIFRLVLPLVLTEVFAFGFATLVFSAF